MEEYIIPIASAMAILIIAYLIRKRVKGKHPPNSINDLSVLNQNYEEVLHQNDELIQKNEILIGAIKEREGRLKTMNESNRDYIIALKDTHQDNLINASKKHLEELANLREYYANVMLEWKDKIQHFYQEKFNSFQENKGMEFTKMMIDSALSITANGEVVDYQSLEEMIKEKETAHEEKWNRKLDDVITESNSISDSMLAEMKVQEAKVSEQFAHHSKDIGIKQVTEEANRKIADANLDNKIAIEKEQRVASDKEITTEMDTGFRVIKTEMESGFREIKSYVDSGLNSLKNHVDLSINEVTHKINDLGHELYGAIKDVDIKHVLNFESITGKFEAYKIEYQKLFNDAINIASRAEVNNSKAELVLNKVNHQYEIFSREKGHFKKEFENAIAELSITERDTSTRLMGIVNVIESKAHYVQDKIHELFRSKLSLDAQANQLEVNKKLLLGEIQNRESDLKRLQDKINQENRHHKDMYTKDESHARARTKDLSRITMLESDVRRGRERYETLSNRLAHVNRLKRA